MELPATFGRYTLRRLLGQGGAGRVYEAELSGPAGFRKRVALKVLGENVSPVTLEGLKREARIGGILKHPNLVDTYDYGEVTAQPYIAMELVDGASLAAMLRRGPLAPSALLDLAGQLCAGLGALHAHGLVHRDLKPGNVLVDRTGLAKIGDFGVAQSGTDEAPEGSGTIGYMAPEQIEGGPTDPRSDLFSLAILLWEALTAERMLPGGVHERASRTFAIERHLRSTGALERVDGLLPGLAGPLGACLAKDPSARPASVADLWAQLRDLEPTGADGAPLATRAGEAAGIGTPPTPRGATSRSRPRGRVPASPDAFFGRRKELAALTDLLERARAITLKGPGGIGKSRLALELARQQRSRLPGGAWFVPLGEAVSEGGVALAVARVLERQVSTDDTARAEIGAALADLGRALVVLDDADAGSGVLPDLVDRWLDDAPELRIVVTCRAVLHVRGEQIVEVGPLSRRAAVDLLRNRVGARGMAWGEEDVIAELADSLDRLPLALELAAGRSGSLGPRQMLERLGDRFRLLGKPDRSDRRATLGAVLEGSFATLQPWEQTALAQLSVFRGGFRLEQAEEVVDLSAFPSAPWILDVLDRLWETSLVRSQAIRGQPRFHLLESVRAFALAELERSGQRDAVRARHARAYVRFDEDHDNPGRPRIPVGERVLELDNLVAAFDTASATGDGETAAHLVLAANMIVRHVAPIDRAIARTDDVLARFTLPSLLRARLQASRGILLGDVERLQEAERDLRAAAEQYVRLGERWRRAAALNNLGAVLRGLGRPQEARAQYEAVIVVARSIAATVLEATAEANLGALDGSPEGAEPRLLRAAALLEAAGPHRDTSLDATVLSNLALCALMKGDTAETVARAELALQTCRNARLRRQGNQVLLTLAAAAELDGDSVARRNHLDAALRAAEELSDPELAANALAELARWALDAELPGDARKYAERAVARLSGRRETPLLHVARAWLGEALVRSGDRDGYALLDDADRALTSEPQARVHVLARYGRVALHGKDRRAAQSRLAAARTIGPQTPIVARELAALERALAGSA